MTLGGKRMKPLGQMQWAGILLAGGGVALSVLSIALMDAHSAATPLKWFLITGIAGVLGGGLCVQCTWKTKRGGNNSRWMINAAPTKPE
jgi:hypothetical protein